MSTFDDHSQPDTAESLQLALPALLDPGFSDHARPSIPRQPWKSPPNRTEKTAMSKNWDGQEMTCGDAFRWPEIAPDSDRSRRISTDRMDWLESCPITPESMAPAVGRPVVFALSAPCRWPGCCQESIYVSEVLCRSHYKTLRKRLRGPNGAATDGRGAPTRELVGYAGAHDRNREHHGHAADYWCELCPAQAAEWALIPSRAAEVCPATGLRYSCNPDDYVPLCRSCHRQLDHAVPHLDGVQLLPLFAGGAYSEPAVRRRPWGGEDR